ncbi:MAG TPA: DASS family sodium-coupled anion symporter [Actinomycetaceae bacterium]|nr:DASS family sodium-coupled anion symporter [Actinomycetaceae bacterium]
MSQDLAIATRPAMRPIQKWGVGLGLVAFLFPFFIDIPGLEEPGERMLSIFLFAIVFWVTEAIPLFATAVAVILLEVFLISDRALLPVGEGAVSYADYFATLANPVIILFLGGFLIADGAEKYGLDKNIAAIFMRPFKNSGRQMLLGLMLITAALSMFMSNTATTATMFAVVIPIIIAMPDAASRSAVALSIPVAANIGGMSTPVATPPNAIAVGALATRGVTVSFLDWMLLTIPLVIVLLFGAWLWIAHYIPKETAVTFDLTAKWDKSRDARIYYAVAGGTVLLWMTEPIHGISSNIVGFIPVVLLLSLRVMTGRDVQNIDWPVLWLVAGGIALGEGVGATGLDAWLLGSVPWDTMSSTMVIALLVLVGLAMSNVISHSASANLLVPLAVSFSGVIGVDMMMIAVVLALSTSLGMSMPISTPPNAIAYATGHVPLKTMAVTGLVVGIGGALLLAFVMPPLWQFLGLI